MKEECSDFQTSGLSNRIDDDGLPMLNKRVKRRGKRARGYAERKSKSGGDSGGFSSD